MARTAGVRPGRVLRLFARSHRQACSLSWLLLVLTSSSAMAAGPKRVLVVHSFASGTPPFTTHSIAFETELTEKIGERVDLDEVSLDMARDPDSTMQEALVEYLHKRHTKWQPDLVVPIGSPAGIFVAQYRDRLFPNAPILYTGMDKRRLPPDALQKNAAFIGESFDLSGFVEDILQVAPATTNIAVVIGASQLERYWMEAFRHEFEPFTNRVSFTWLNDLSLDQMLEHVSKLPPHSYIFLILLLRDASGVTHNADEALRRIHAVANAPINSIFQNQLGLGIVGGRLYQAELEGVESARIAIRILHGEAATNFPPKIIGPLSPQYDWRELQRWGISEAGLPRGSTILFRVPTVWARYRAWFIAGISACLLEALLISLLVANLVRRRRAERSLVESEVRFRIAANAAPIMIWMSDLDRFRMFFNTPWLEFTGRTLHQEMGTGWIEGVHPDDLRSYLKTYFEAFDGRGRFVAEYRLRRQDGEYRQISDAGSPRFDNQGNFAGYTGSCVDVTESRRKTDALAESENRLRAILNTAVEGIITINDNGVIESVNRATEKIFGYPAVEIIGRNVSWLILDRVRDDQSQTTFDFKGIRSTSLSRVDREVRGRRKDGSIFPMGLAMSRVELPGRRFFTGFVRDITEWKQAEKVMREFGGHLLQAQEAERARLARELHDDITQRLARLAIDAGSVEWAKATPQISDKMRSVRDGLAHLSEDIHALSYRLHSSVLEELGLAEALKVECERFSKQELVPAEVKFVTSPDVLPPETALCLFRVAQEALRNVARHSQARAVGILVRGFDDGLELTVSDDGIGFNPALQRDHVSLGLASMRERLLLLDGKLDIHSSPGEGTTIVAWVPLKKEQT